MNAFTAEIFHNKSQKLDITSNLQDNSQLISISPTLQNLAAEK